MNKHFCPNCGHRLKPGQTFCGHCGYNLKTHRMPGGRRVASRMSRPVPPRQPQPMYGQPPRRHNYGLAIIIVLVVIILAGGGYYGYKKIEGPSTTQQQSQQNGNANNSNNNNSNGNTNSNSNNTSSSNSGETIPQNTAMNILSKVFDRAGDMVNNGDDGNMSSYFANGDSNSDYKVLHDWADDQHHSESLDGLDMGVASVSGISNSDGASKATCHVKYHFHYDSSTKNQTFAWYAKFKKIGGQWEITSLKANNNPISSN